MTNIAHQVLAYGAVSIVGGLDGYFTAGSTASLVAGLACGGALCAGAYGLYGDRKWGWWTSLAVSVALVLRFTPSFRHSGEIYPAGIMAGLGIWVIGALIVGYIQQVDAH